jgi:hypothetical protein
LDDEAVGGVVDSVGTKFDRTRTTDLVGWDVLRSTADAGRVGGPELVLVPDGKAPDLPGEVVCALDGGGRGGGSTDFGGAPDSA